MLMDALFIGVSIAFFAITIVAVYLCEKLHS